MLENPRVWCQQQCGNSVQAKGTHRSLFLLLLFSKYVLPSKHQFKSLSPGASLTTSPHFRILQVLGAERLNVKLFLNVLVCFDSRYGP